MKTPILGARLASAAGLVRQGAYLADIGTDHAFLPIFLLAEGKISRAVCSDINEGPLATAQRNVSEAGFSDKVEFRLCNGAAKLSGLGITDYAICGMGGELIADIINNARQLFDSGVNLILQPMTRRAHLVRFLAERGFQILAEEYSVEAGRAYATLLVRFSGEVWQVSDFEAEFGKFDPRVAISRERNAYIEAKKRTLSVAAKGKILGGEQNPPELILLSEIEKIL